MHITALHTTFQTCAYSSGQPCPISEIHLAGCNNDLYIKFPQLKRHQTAKHSTGQLLAFSMHWCYQTHMHSKEKRSLSTNRQNKNIYTTEVQQLDSCNSFHNSEEGIRIPIVATTTSEAVILIFLNINSKACLNVSNVF